MPVIDVNAPKITQKVTPPVGTGQAQEPSFIDDVMKVRRQKMAEKLVEDELGTRRPAEQSESLATTIVTKAMDNLSKAEERAEKAVDRSRDEAAAANAALEQAKENVYKVQLESMTAMLQRLERAQEDIKKGAGSKSFADVAREAKELLAVINPQGSERAAAVAAPVDFNAQLQLTKMQMDHELALKKMDLEMNRSNQEFNLKLQEFADNRAMKKTEYEDSKALRHQGLSAVEDIAVAVSQAVGGDSSMEEPIPAKAPGEVKTPAPSASEGNFEASILSFPCQVCKTTIAVPEEGGDIACPNCGATYNVNKGGE
jgi:hypothetical protein